MLPSAICNGPGAPKNGRDRRRRECLEVVMGVNGPLYRKVDQQSCKDTDLGGMQSPNLNRPRGMCSCDLLSPIWGKHHVHRLTLDLELLRPEKRYGLRFTTIDRHLNARRPHDDTLAVDPCEQFPGNTSSTKRWSDPYPHDLKCPCGARSCGSACDSGDSCTANRAVCRHRNEPEKWIVRRFHMTLEPETVLFILSKEACNIGPVLRTYGPEIEARHTDR